MNDNSQKRLRRVIAIISLVFVAAGFGFMVASLIAKDDMSRNFNLIALICYILGIVLFAVLYFSGAFPQRQAKEKEKRELEAAYYNKLAEQEAAKEIEKEQQQADNGETEKQDLPQ